MKLTSMQLVFFAAAIAAGRAGRKRVAFSENADCHGSEHGKNTENIL